MATTRAPAIVLVFALIFLASIVWADLCLLIFELRGDVMPDLLVHINLAATSLGTAGAIVCVVLHMCHGAQCCGDTCEY